MRQFDATVTACAPAGCDHIRIDFTVPWERPAAPGQFVMLGAGGTTLLKRPFSIAACGNGTAAVIIRAIGPATRSLTAVRPGDAVPVVGPLGVGFPAVTGPVIYVGGGCGMPPLVYHLIAARPRSATVYAGFRRAQDVILADAFAAAGARVVIATEDGSEGERGLVTGILEKNLDCAKSTGIIFASGPMGMLRVVADIVARRNITAYLCIERYMACGFGACNGCAQKVREADGTVRYARACTEGPVFESGRLVWE
ncbi:MAG: dihydroorotate dehydrogenase electron transfer subunit [Planctomycetota bacterium]